MNPNTHQEPPLPQELVNLAELSAEQSCPIVGQDQSRGSPSPSFQDWVQSSPTSQSSSSSYQDSRPLHGVRPPKLIIQEETAEHRLMIFLKAQGMQNKDIAARLDATEAAVSVVLRQDWARQAIVEEITRAGRDAVELILKGAALKAAAKLEALIDDEQATKETQRKASLNVLEQVYGQKFEFTKQVNVAAMDDDSLDAFISQKTN